MMEVIKDLNELNNKRVLFVTTKGLDYIRNVQEVKLLMEAAPGTYVIGSYNRSYFVRLISVIFKLSFTSFKRYDAVLVGFAPQLILPLFGKKMKRSGCMITEDFFISLYDTFCHDRKRFMPDSMIGRWLHKLDTRTLKAADEIICDTAAHAGYFTEEFGVSADRCKVLYIEADKDVYHPMNLDRIDVMAEYFGDVDLKDKKIALYFGSVLPLQGTDTVIEAMTELATQGYICIFIGPADNIDQAIYHRSWLPQLGLAKLIDISDICLAGHFNDRITKAHRTIPGKAFIYEAMHKPMVLGDNSANREYFEESDTVCFAHMSDADAIVEAVKMLSEKA